MCSPCPPYSQVRTMCHSPLAVYWIVAPCGMCTSLSCIHSSGGLWCCSLLIAYMIIVPYGICIPLLPIPPNGGHVLLSYLGVMCNCSTIWNALSCPCTLFVPHNVVNLKSCPTFNLWHMGLQYHLECTTLHAAMCWSCAGLYLWHMESQHHMECAHHMVKWQSCAALCLWCVGL